MEPEYPECVSHRIPGSYQGVKNDARHTVGLPADSRCRIFLRQLVVRASAERAKNQSADNCWGVRCRSFIAETHGILRSTASTWKRKNLPNSDVLRASLAAGKGDLAYLAVDNAVAMVELAHQDVVIVMGGEGSQNELIAQPEIKIIKDLAGKLSSSTRRTRRMRCK